MSRSGDVAPLGLFRAPLVALLCVLSTPWLALAADLVVLRDGSEVRGRLIEVNAHQVVLDGDDGQRKNVQRGLVARIEFGETPAQSLRAQVRVFEADDEVSITIDGQPVAKPVELKQNWIDLVPMLHEGANELRATVKNEAQFWAYRWVLDAGGEKKTFACGQARRAGCRDGGRSGAERGELPAGRVWLYVHKSTGEIKVDVQPE